MTPQTPTATPGEQAILQMLFSIMCMLLLGFGYWIAMTGYMLMGAALIFFVSILFSVVTSAINRANKARRAAQQAEQVAPPIA